jgi:lipid-binding SYLF domain-containing protein
MKILTSISLIIALALAVGFSPTAIEPAKASSADVLEMKADGALQDLYREHPGAAAIGSQAKSVLVFPNVVKAGLVFGGSYGEGVRYEDGQVVDYYNTVTGSWGLQAGVQTYGYALFLMTDSAVEYLRDSAGLEIGVGPNVVVVDEGVAANLSTTTLQDDAYAFVFDQMGLMAGVSIEGTKITRINR